MSASTFSIHSGSDRTMETLSGNSLAKITSDESMKSRGNKNNLKRGTCKKWLVKLA